MRTKNKKRKTHTNRRKALVSLFIGVSLLTLTGCHGSKALPTFTAPAEFDTSKNYEVTFWAKNDTNKNQTDIYKKPLRTLSRFTPTSKST